MRHSLPRPTSCTPLQTPVHAAYSVATGASERDAQHIINGPERGARRVPNEIRRKPVEAVCMFATPREHQNEQKLCELPSVAGATTTSPSICRVD